MHAPFIHLPGPKVKQISSPDSESWDLATRRSGEAADAAVSKRLGLHIGPKRGG
jgi:hypothetical protein